MKHARRIREILDEVEALERDINHGERAWSEGTDNCAMAECDPSDQFVKGMEVEALILELKGILDAE